MLKKLLFFIIPFSLLSLTLSAQWQWAIRGGSVNSFSRTTDYNNVNHITTDQSGNVYILAQVGGAGLKVAENSLIAYSEYGTYNSLDIVLTSFTVYGGYRWSKVIGGRLYDVGYALKADKNGGIYVTGRVRNVDDNPVGAPNNAVHFDTDTILPKIPYDTLTWSLIQDTLNQSLFIVKYDTAGALHWLTMPEPDSTSRFRGNTPINLDVDANGDAYWLCHLLPGEYRWANNNIVTQAGTYVVKYNNQGNQIGITRLSLDVAHGDYLTSIWGGLTHFARNPMTGNYYIAGTNKAKQYSYLLIDGDTIHSDMYLAAFSPTGQLLWKKESGGADLGQILDMDVDINGDIYLTGDVWPGTEFGGHTFTSPSGKGAPYISVFDPSGNNKWSLMGISRQASTEGSGIAVSDTEVAITGYTGILNWPNETDTVTGVANQGFDAFLARFNKSNGELITMERTNTPFGGASYGNAIAAGPQNTYYLGGNFSMSMFLGQDTLYKVGSQRSFFLTKYECDVPEASMNVIGINATNTINLTYTGDPADSVKWYLGDGTQVWGDSIQHSYAAKGKYRVCAMAYFECTEVTVCDSLVAGEISLEEQSLAEVAIYPNPTNSLLYLENLPKHSSVKLYNLNGKMLLQKQFKHMKASLDLSQLSKGVYLLELQNNNGESDFRKVMKE
ncbi:T9SS type A sorting domain-containing protein [Owenweeksia hongkongensis]|uniref:T9SS type A sorting domain-containing protein n=1 Tax=Owenweeksia hongkongensis TaxID=253245 RepID=UPI003A907B47